MAKNTYRKLDTVALQSASKRHKLVWELVKELFPHNNIYQEYPVVKVNPEYYFSREHYDIVVLDLQIVVEVHGEQHSRPVNFGGISDEEATLNYNTQVITDKRKKEAAIEAGFTFVEIWHYEDVDNELILRKIQENLIREKPQEQKKEDKPEWKQQRLQKAKEYRRQDYLRRKERQKERKLGKQN